VTLGLIFEWLWLPLKGISIVKTYRGEDLNTRVAALELAVQVYITAL
jgi:hypothetical protein